MEASLILSVCFLAVCAISLIFGAYVLYNDVKSKLNWAFFAVCASLSVWAFGFSIAVSAPDVQTCLFWRRFSAFGWGIIFSFILHFFLILARKQKLLRQWWTYLLLYLPALVTLCAFSLPTGINPVPYQLINTPLGWTNIAHNTIWDWYYDVHYGSFMLGGLWIIWRWYKTASSRQTRKQARLILSSFAITLFIGTLTDMVLNSFLPVKIPQIAPIIMLIPVTTMYCSMRFYGLMKSETIDEDEIILKGATRSRIYYHISIVSIAGGFLNFISQYLLLDDPDIQGVLLLSAFLILSGLLVQLVQRLKLKNGVMDMIVTIWVLAVIPFISLQYVEYASLTIWAFPFILIIVSLLFNRRSLLIAVSVSVFVTQMIIWIMVPSAVVVVDKANYIGRIGMFGLAIWLAFFVHRAYLLRLKENAYQLRFQRLIAAISTDFANVNPMNLDEKVNAMLGECGVFFEVDRTCVYLIDRGGNAVCATHTWTKKDLNIRKALPGCVPLDQLPWLMKQIDANAVVYVANTDKFESEAAKEMRLLNENGLQTLVCGSDCKQKTIVLGVYGLRVFKP